MKSTTSLMNSLSGKREAALPSGGMPSGSLAAPRVLVVDDNSSNLAVFEAILTDPGFELVTAQSGVEAMRHLLSTDFAAILLDINMPTMDGLQTAQLIRERERSRDVPIIFITAYQPDQAQLLAGYASGAVDYLVKPVSPEILKSKVRIFVELFRKSRQVEWQARQLRAVNLQLQHEVQQREEAERDAAFEREERQSVTLASIADAVFTCDREGRVLSLNPMAEHLTERRSDDVKGQLLSDVISTLGEGEEGLEALVTRCAAEDRLLRSSEPIQLLRGASEARYLDYAAAPVHDRLGRVIGTVLVTHDVTTRHEMARERARALRLEQAARRIAEDTSRAREEFLAVISHELRTPLNAIVGWTHVLRTDGLNERYARQAVEAIHRSAMAQKKLIEDLLDMSRIINGKIELVRQPVDLAAVVATAVDTLRPTADEKDVILQCSFGTPVDETLADRVRIEQVVWNVLSNAIKFTPDGGTVRVRLDRDDKQARIVVSDSGQGIPHEFLKHVFDAFRQADSTTTRRQGGLGLGLAIARQLIVMHGGSIHAESAGVDQGTTVTITLPLVDCAGASTDAATQADFAADTSMQRGEALRDISVLVVDDDVNTLTLLSIALREQGAQVNAVSGPDEGMRLLQLWRPQVLLSDISMPGEDGYSFIRRVRNLPAEEGGAVLGLALTAMASVEDRAKALDAGFDGHVVKPLDLPALVDTLAHMLRGAGSAETP
ncbi:MAG TPA: response regulator [Burkholderiales bacterium]|nr:response regulator [Burkholderiales bacterium]